MANTMAEHTDVDHKIQAAAELKVKGNAAATTKQPLQAVEAYISSLKVLVPYVHEHWVVCRTPPVVSIAELTKVVKAQVDERLHLTDKLLEAITTTLCNRAACYAQIGKNWEAVYDCTCALSLNPSYVKARWRRAQALFAMGNLSDTAMDCEVIERQGKGEVDAVFLGQVFALKQRVKALGDAGTARYVTSDLLSATGELDQSKFIASMQHMRLADRGAALSLVTSGRLTELLRLVPDRSSAIPSVAGMLGAVVDDESNRTTLSTFHSSSQVIEDLSSLSDMFVCEMERDPSTLGALSSAYTLRLLSKITLPALTTAATEAYRAVPSSTSDADAPIWPVELPVPFSRAIAKFCCACLHYLKSCKQVDGVNFLASVRCLSTEIQAGEGRELLAKAFVEESVCSEALRCVALLYTAEKGWDSDAAKVLTAFVTVCLRALQQGGVSHRPNIGAAKLRWGFNTVVADAAIVLNKLYASIVAGENDMMDDNVPECAVVVLLCLHACYIVDAGLTAKLSDSPLVLLSVFIASGSSHHRWQICACDVISNLSSSEETRGHLQTFVSDLQSKPLTPLWRSRFVMETLYERLMESPSYQVRAAAIAAITKLTGGTQAFSILPDSTAGTAAASTTGVSAKAAAAEKLTMSVLEILEDQLPAEAAKSTAAVSVDVLALSRAIEAAATIANHTISKRLLAESEHIKRLVAAGDQLLACIAKSERVAEARPALFGVCYIFMCLSISRSRQRAEALADMEIDVQQYKQLQKLAMPHAADDKIADDEEEDPQPAVESRVKQMVAAGVPAFLIKVDKALRGGSGNMSASRHAIATMLRNMAECVSVRGSLVAAGCVPLLVSLSSDAKPPHKHTAGHALGRLLISTNPTLLPDEHVMDAIPELIAVVRDSPSQLEQFEALMGLTNLLSASVEARDRALACGMLNACEVCQFTEHKLLRRAATEALTNVATTDDGCRLIGKSRLPLWLSLADVWERPVVQPDKSTDPTAAAKARDPMEDTPTALAALGGIAMTCMAISDDADAIAEFSQRFVFARGHIVFGHVLLSGHAGLVHRCLVVCQVLASIPVCAAAFLCTVEEEQPELTVFALVTLMSKGRLPSIGEKSGVSSAPLDPSLQGIATEVVKAIQTTAADSKAVTAACTVQDPDNAEVSMQLHPLSLKPTK